MVVTEALGLCFGFFALYWVALQWLRHHGGVTPLRLWPVYIVLSVLLAVGIGLIAQPIDPDPGLFVVLVVTMGLGGVVAGPFFPLPRSDERALLRREAERRATSDADDHQDGGSSRE